MTAGAALEQQILLGKAMLIHKAPLSGPTIAHLLAWGKQC
jgi:hypothetical protein